VREQTQLRLKLEDEEAKKTRKAKHDKEILNLQLKLKQKELDLKKADGTLGKTEVAKAKAALDKEKFSAKQDKLLLDAKNLQRLNTLAAHVCKRIKKYWSGKTKEHAALAVKASELGPSPTDIVKKMKAKIAPAFFKVEVSKLRNVAYEGWDCEGKKKKTPAPEWCSRDFVLQVYNGPIGEAKHPDLKTNLRLLINFLLPGYGKFLGAGFNVDCLMLSNGNVADLCFSEAVWRYTNCVGLDSLPCGLAKWPPGEEAEETDTKGKTGGKAADTKGTEGEGTGGKAIVGPSPSCASSCKGCPSCQG